VLPAADRDDVMQRLEATGVSVQADGDALMVTDPFGLHLRLVSMG
jgi:hypothetical protein